MLFHCLPSRTAGAAENMATDFLLLQRYPEAATPRFRHYGWRQPSFTFGYSQKIAWVREQLPGDERFELCRRPTGGGIVDHREDWTYALVIPRGHPLEEVRAAESYRLIHEAIAAALQSLGVPAETKPCAEPESGGTDSSTISGICFQRAEIYDVIRSDSGEKIAGAAQKRNKHGLLFQGSVARAAARARSAIDWDAFSDAFIAELATALEVDPRPVPWPDFNEDEVSALTEQYASPEWLEFR